MKYKLIKNGDIFAGYSADENGEYTEEEAERIVICQKIDATEDDYNKKIAEKEAEWTANEYARNRQAEYPDWGTQLNKIYDDGLTKWKTEMVDPVKAKYPKTD
tara:strand:+ start:163 stop:471 length:309 start_codon:yes stop_codon:yes gene_type:complete